MAVIRKNTIQFTGTIQNLSFYTMQGCDKVIVRTKGGPSKRQIEKSEKFASLRNNNNEWRGCTQMAKAIRDAMGAVKDLADFPLIGTLNGLAKKIQTADTESEHGKRTLRLSHCKELAGGINVSRKQVFESILSSPLYYTIDRSQGCASINIPSIDTGMQLHNALSFPYFRIMMVLGTVSDLKADSTKGYSPVNWSAEGLIASYTTEWLPTNGTTAAQLITLTLGKKAMPLPDSVTLILSIGIEFGKTGYDGLPAGVKYSGCGKIALLA